MSTSSTEPSVPFNRPQLTGGELAYIAEAVENLHLSGNGPFTRRCAELLEERLGCERVLLTPSGTAALELGALTLGLGRGDEVIMPSFTFPTTASAVALRGATPVFVDVRKETLNIDVDRVAEAITERTRAIVPVHYAGVACEMADLVEVADRHGLAVLEDAAHAIGASCGGRPLGSFGSLAALSFHETKNASCGEGGALLINDPALIEAAEILQEKGTNRSAFFRGEVDKYTWIEVGSSFVLSDVSAAFLLAQLEHLDEINGERRRIWDRYMEGFEELERSGAARRPIHPPGAEHNGHLFYLLLSAGVDRDGVIAKCCAAGVQAVFHYVPLHSSPAGRRLGRVAGSMKHTDRASEGIMRLPLWVGMDEGTIERVISTVNDVIGVAAAPVAS